MLGVDQRQATTTKSTVLRLRVSPQYTYESPGPVSKPRAVKEYYVTYERNLLWTLFFLPVRPETAEKNIKDRMR